ncbi:CARDB domain-containing protein [Leptolyngbya sp. 7M]|uniref:CARDB domain-containing protein n=1 Tax=Leptolyngbya sp. 7M TaxID=2812896 RepID=UPI001B8BEB4C|nr:CARDB domain-containing protein [Leptolyngbya sp. 7M]QYO65309.1 PD40 domain-containing protein [Leptolyngbya sp. 7M]
MMSLRNRRYRAILRYAALSIFAAASLTLVVSGVVRSSISAGVAFVVGKSSVAAAELSPSGGEKNAGEEYKLQDVSGLFLFELDNTLQKLENIGTSNNVSNFTYLADSEPVFSPDGSKILFRTQRAADFPPGNPGELWIMDPTGFNQRRLTFNSSTEGNFSISRNGQKITFQHMFEDRIWVINSDGTGLTEIPNPSEDLTSRPALSPDGSKVMFERNYTIWIANTDGTNIQELTQGGGEYPFFSHDGQKVYWINGAAIYRADPDGSNEETLVDGSNGSYDNFRGATLSPDGQKLLFECERFSTSGICVAPTDGSNMLDLIEEPGETLKKPVWSPNGSQIAYIRTGQDGRQRIAIASSNGTTRFEVFNTESPSQFIGRLAWQPECNETGGPSEPPIITDGLVSWWRGEFNPLDSAGDNDGGFAEPAYVTEGRVGNAFYFNGNGEDNFVEVPDNSSLDIQNSNYTLAGWVNIQADQREHYFFGKGACCTGSNFYVGVDENDRPFIDISHESGGSRITAFGHELDLYTWTHLALRREGNEFRLYKNGQHVVTHTENQPIGTNDAPFTIGKGDGVTAPELTAFGMADEIVLYNRALSQSEIQALVNMSAAMLGSSNCPTVEKSRISIGGPFLWPVAQGRSVQVEIRLSDPAPVGGTTISLSSTDPGEMTVPASVIIPEGEMNTFFDATTMLSVPPSTAYSSADIIATEGSHTARTTVVIAPASADLAASDLIAPATVNIRQNFSADITVTNNGQVATGSYREDEIWISQDPILFNDPGDSFIGLKFDNSGILAPGQSKVFAATNINIPSSAIPTDGTYYLFYRVGRNIPERNGNFQDNYAFVPIQVSRNLPDLIAENVQIPTEIEPGVQFTINWDVRNAGNAATLSGFSHIVYISFDQTIGNADDIAITQRNTAAMAAGQTQSFSQQYTVPTLPVRASSDALIYVVVDTAGQVFEDDPGGPAETNNTTSIQTRFEYRVPDLQVQSVTPPAEVDSDTSFPIEWTTTNAGLRASGPMWERVFFSTDAQVGNDVQLGEFIYNSPIQPGASITRIQNVTIPTNSIPATGNYFIYVQTDAFNQINEGENENNNITFAPVQVRRLLRPDLQVTNTTAPASAFFDQEIQVQWTVTNYGTGPTNSPNWTDDVWLNANQTIAGGVRLASGSNVSFLNAGESYIASATVKIPRGFTGSYFLIIRTDTGNTVNEENESNNFATRPIMLNVPLLPDLRVSNVQAPDEGFAGAPIQVSWTVTNHGDGAVPPGESVWNDRIFISRDAVFDGSDRAIGIRQRTGTLAPGSSYTVSNYSIELPHDSFGEYYVFVVTDALDQVYEFTNENNNSDHDRVEPGSPMNVLGTPPDLTIPFPISAPSTINAGQPLTANFTVRNQGAFDAVGTWRDALYLSTDQNLDPLNDLFLGSAARTNLGAGQSYAASMNVTVPNCLDGNFFLIAATDAFNNIFEFDPKGDGEANNLGQPKAIAISTFAPDLRVTNIVVPPVVINGAMPISWTVRNFGTTATIQTSWTDRIYLINNNQIITLGNFQRQGSLSIDGEYTQNQVVNVPLFLQGDVTIYVQTDATNVVPECSFEENNQNNAITQLQSDLPDLRINSISAPSTAVLGARINIGWTGQNFGSAMPQTSWIDRAYLSTNSTFEPHDTPLGSVILNQSLSTNGTYSTQIEAVVPSVPIGNYFLIVLADANGHVSEGLNENNNAASIPILLSTPPVDLQVTSLTADQILFSGQFANISWTVTNLGSQATASAAWTDWLVLSRDGVFDPTDVVLAFQRRNGALGPGESYSDNRIVPLPSGLTGDYRILLITDRHNEVFENNETNNISSAHFNLQLPPPAELNITNISPPSTISLGEPTTFEWTVQNASPNSASGIWQDSIYLSTDQVWDSGDIFVASKQRSGTLAAFATYTEHITTVIPPVDPGNYYIIIRTDSRNTVRESDETNNVASSAGISTVTVQELTLGVPIDTTLVTGQERFYRISDVSGDETMLVSLFGQIGNSNELFTRFGSMVSRANFEFQGDRPGEANQRSIIRETSEGDYFTMIRGDLVPGSFAEDLRKNDVAAKSTSDSSVVETVTIRADILPFSIQSVSPETAGNRGVAGIQIDGAKFAPGASVKLVGGGGVEIVPAGSSVSSSRIAAIFDLTDKPVGRYNVVVTNPDQQSAILDDGFEIVAGGGHDLRVSIVPPTATRGGVKKRVVFSVANDGLNDALNVPIFIQMPIYGYQLDRSNYLDLPQEQLPPDITPSQVPLHIDIDGVRTIMLYAPIIRSRSTTNIQLDIDIPFNFGAFPLSVQILRPMSEFANGLDPRPGEVPEGLIAASAFLNPPTPVDPSCYVELFRQVFFAVLSEVLGRDCLKAGWLAVTGLADAASGLFLGAATGSLNTWGIISAFAQKFSSAAISSVECAGKSIPWIKAFSLAVTLVQILSQLDDCLTNGNFKTTVLFRQPTSFDPNEKLGPDGFGPEKFVGIQQPIEYRINFENLASAEAPAQVIRIVDQLPPTLDPRTLRLREIGFKQYRIVVPENRAFYQTRLQLGEDLGNLQAEISAGLNITDGTVTWNLTAIDPQTNERPLDPLVGLLPPNNEQGDGEGYVTFTIKPRATQPTGTDLANFATIFFDENEPIVTNTTTNLLDADIPESSVLALPLTSNEPTINLSWTGSDAAGGAGLERIDIYYSEDGGTFRTLTSSTGPGSIQFTGNWGRSYRFYSIAADNAGNIEPAPETWDAETIVLGGAFEGDVAPRPNGDNDGAISVADLTQIRRFVAELDTNFEYNEFQRADTAPAITGGDGSLSIADIIQTRRYAAGLDEVAFASGPNEASAPLNIKTIYGEMHTNGSRDIRPVRVVRTGSRITVGIDLEAQGDEVAVGFTLGFDPNVISNPSNVTLGTGASGSALTINANQSNSGRLGIVIDRDPTQPFPAGTVRLLTIDFDVSPSMPSTALISFGNAPVRREIVNGLAQALTTNFVDTTIPLVGPTAATVTISGRVLQGENTGVGRVRIQLQSFDGTTIHSFTNSLGNYSFSGVPAGGTYILSASHPKYSIPQSTRVITAVDNVFDENFWIEECADNLCR